MQYVQRVYNAVYRVTVTCVVRYAVDVAGLHLGKPDNYIQFLYNPIS